LKKEIANIEEKVQTYQSNNMEVDKIGTGWLDCIIHSFIDIDILSIIHIWVYLSIEAYSYLMMVKWKWLLLFKINIAIMIKKKKIKLLYFCSSIYKENYIYLTNTNNLSDLWRSTSVRILLNFVDIQNWSKYPLVGT